jgi:hypothetical protein
MPFQAQVLRVYFLWVFHVRFIQLQPDIVQGRVKERINFKAPVREHSSPNISQTLPRPFLKGTVEKRETAHNI